MNEPDATARARRQYDGYAPRYDQDTSYYDRVMLGDGRRWVCSQARGDTLEVAVGTGRNLAFYPPGVPVWGIDVSAGMLAHARARADELERRIELLEGDAQAMPFADATFDTVVCTLGLSSIPDDRAALAEIYRVLRPAGHLVLLGHVASPYRPVRAAQRLLERLSSQRGVDDTQTRRTAGPIRDTGFVVAYRRSFRLGAIERLTAVKPSSGS